MTEQDFGFRLQHTLGSIQVGCPVVALCRLLESDFIKILTEITMSGEYLRKSVDDATYLPTYPSIEIRQNGTNSVLRRNLRLSQPRGILSGSVDERFTVFRACSGLPHSHSTGSHETSHRLRQLVIYQCLSHSTFNDHPLRKGFKGVGCVETDRQSHAFPTDNLLQQGTVAFYVRAIKPSGKK